MDGMADIGIRIKRLRKERGLTQEQVAELIGEDVMSLSTYKRIEEGKSSVNLRRAYHISKALSCKPTDLISDIDDRREAIKAFYAADGVDLDEEELKNLDDSLLLMRLCYPEVPNDPLYTRFAITNLMQFIIYLPLMDPLMLMNSLLGIDGDAFDREYYVLQKIAYIHRMIPESDAKKYADMMASECTADYFMDYHRTSGMTELNKYLIDRENWDESWKLHEAYRSVIEKHIDKIRAAYVISTQ